MTVVFCLPNVNSGFCKAQKFNVHFFVTQKYKCKKMYIEDESCPTVVSLSSRNVVFNSRPGSVFFYKSKISMSIFFQNFNVRNPQAEKIVHWMRFLANCGFLRVDTWFFVYRTGSMVFLNEKFQCSFFFNALTSGNCSGKNRTLNNTKSRQWYFKG